MMILARLKKRLTGLLQRHYGWALNALPEDERKAHLDTMRRVTTEPALERLRKAQGVDFLPETYRQYMLAQGVARTRKGGVALAGSHKLGWMRQQGGLYEDHQPQALLRRIEKSATRNQLIMRLGDYGLSYPEDLFVFFTDLWCTFYFFRTQPHHDNPAVYSYEGGNCFYKLTDSFSEFLALATGETKAVGLWEAGHQAAYLFDPAKDTFVPASGPDFSHLPLRLREALAAPRLRTASFYGCTEADLETLRKAQEVECLPEVYRQVMLAVGGYGLSRILDGYADFGKNVQEMKWYTKEFRDDALDYPPDLFLFMGHDQGTGCRFFRTAGCPDDPPVYGYWEDGAYHKLADSLTDYLVWELEHDPYVRDEVSDRIYGID
ncbi:MAG: SMI1/KNR4 family protein [Anaerolineae bacterium]|nr:SMI1/KNR4 family protein [Anaerolineae bacterium]